MANTKFSRKILQGFYTETQLMQAEFFDVSTKDGMYKLIVEVKTIYLLLLNLLDNALAMVKVSGNRYPDWIMDANNKKQ